MTVKKQHEVGERQTDRHRETEREKRAPDGTKKATADDRHRTPGEISVRSGHFRGRPIQKPKTTAPKKPSPGQAKVTRQKSFRHMREAFVGRSGVAAGLF